MRVLHAVLVGATVTSTAFAMGHGDHSHDDEKDDTENREMGEGPKYGPEPPRAGPEECAPVKGAPADDGGLIPKGGMYILEGWETNTDFPEECGPTFWDGNQEMFRVPDYCCTEAVGVTRFVDLDADFDGGATKCKNLYPFGPNLRIAPKLASGCAADGTQFYGEKCGGSDFYDVGQCSDGVQGFSGDCEGRGGTWTPVDDYTYGFCGPVENECDCFSYVEVKGPACYVAAVPNPAAIVLFKAEGCQDSNGDFVVPSRDSEDGDSSDGPQDGEDGPDGPQDGEDGPDGPQDGEDGSEDGEKGDEEKDYCKGKKKDGCTGKCSYDKKKKKCSMKSEKQYMEEMVEEIVDAKLEKFEEKIQKKLMKILEAAGFEDPDAGGDDCGGANKKSKCDLLGDSCKWDKKGKFCKGRK